MVIKVKSLKYHKYLLIKLLAINGCLFEGIREVNDKDMTIEWSLLSNNHLKTFYKNLKDELNLKYIIPYKEDRSSLYDIFISCPNDKEFYSFVRKDFREPIDINLGIDVDILKHGIDPTIYESIYPDSIKSLDALIGDYLNNRTLDIDSLYDKAIEHGIFNISSECSD
jgi:hypothetical protein